MCCAATASRITQYVTELTYLLAETLAVRVPDECVSGDGGHGACRLRADGALFFAAYGLEVAAIRR